MRKILNVYVIIGLVVLAALLMFSMTYTVRFTEVAVKTTFGQAKAGAIKAEPGFYLKAPYPFQEVTKYDKRIRLIQSQSETQQTRDDFQVVIEVFMTYRVSDPLKFFQNFSNAGDRAEDHYASAQNGVLRDLLRSALGETSKFSMDDLFSPVAGGSKLPELENRILTLLTNGGDAGVSGDAAKSGKAMAEYGIEVVTVGIDRVVLPEATTDSVITRMGAGRDRLAERFESEGRSQAQAIRAEAQSNANKILAFARRRADEILARGEAEAAPYLAEQNSNPELAVFIQNIAMIRDAMARKWTLIFSSSDYGMQLFDPDVVKNAGETLPVPASSPQASGSEN